MDVTPPQKPSFPLDPLFPYSPASQNSSGGAPPVLPRREYVWRTMDRGQQSLASIANRIALDLDMRLSSLNEFVLTDGQCPHRCAGYVREEITLASTLVDSAVVFHDAPSPLEICSICREVVGLSEQFRCICRNSSMYAFAPVESWLAHLSAVDPGSQPTVKCDGCKFWSHVECVGNSTDFTCQFCTIGTPHTSQPSNIHGAAGAARRSALQRTRSIPKQPATVSPSLPHRTWGNVMDHTRVDSAADCPSVAVPFSAGLISSPGGPCFFGTVALVLCNNGRL
jgi:hypothetical protein